MEASQRRTERHAVTGAPRRTQWNIDELRVDLAKFEDELRSAGLKEHTIQTYVGRSKTFLDWLDRRYEPRGPNA